MLPQYAAVGVGGGLACGEARLGKSIGKNDLRCPHVSE
jgi:hypothetical protein